MRQTLEPREGRNEAEEIWGNRTFHQYSRMRHMGYGRWTLARCRRQHVGCFSASSHRARRELHRHRTLYGSGHAERLIGAVIREVKGKVVVGTKIPPKNNLRPPLPGVRVGEVFPYDDIVSCTEQSLRNLNLECLELQQFHVWNSEWLADDTWGRAIEDLKKSGKIRYFGVSLSNPSARFRT